jgi:predicted nucleic acid-binding protein
MRTIFADTFYWVSLANPKDEWHARVKDLSRGIQPAFVVTTDEVLTEFLTF